jgi:hypothetical protein
VDLRRERLGAEADDAGIDVAVGDGGEQRLVRQVGQRDLDRGMGAMEGPERLGQAPVDRPGDADPQPPVQHAAQ